ncbi:MAG: HPr family phosphocarrier protein [Termitinemataceae bacterium]|nr:MAG: HPr family phosphocarrier protein [Termitinemataceae bacterium]
MQTFEYIIKDPIGIHARPAGELVAEAKKFKSTMTLAKGDKSADLVKLFALLKLGVKSGETVTIAITGEDEDAAAAAIKAFLAANL